MLKAVVLGAEAALVRENTGRAPEGALTNTIAAAVIGNGARGVACVAYDGVLAEVTRGAAAIIFAEVPRGTAAGLVFKRTDVHYMSLE